MWLTRRSKLKGRNVVTCFSIFTFFKRLTLLTLWSAYLLVQDRITTSRQLVDSINMDIANLLNDFRDFSTRTSLYLPNFLSSESRHRVSVSFVKLLNCILLFYLTDDQLSFSYHLRLVIRSHCMACTKSQSWLALRSEELPKYPFVA